MRLKTTAGGSEELMDAGRVALSSVKREAGSLITSCPTPIPWPGFFEPLPNYFTPRLKG